MLAPWGADDLVRVLGQGLLGLVVIVVGAYLSSRADDPQRALIGLNVAIAGLVVAGLANGLWLLRLRRTLSRARSLALQRTGLLLEVPGPISVPTPAAQASPGDPDMVAVASGTARFHVPACAFAGGRAVELIGAAEAERRGLRRCEVCQP